MADDGGCLTLIGIGLLIGLIGHSCSKEEKLQPSSTETSAPISVTETTNAPDPIVVPAPPPPPLPNYDSREGRDYYYVAAVSEEQRKRGTVAGSAIGFRYLGRNDDGEDTLFQLPDGPYAYCNRPCRVIRFGNDERIGFNPSSIVGAAFEDVRRGLLKPYLFPKAKTKKVSEPATDEIPMDSISE